MLTQGPDFHGWIWPTRPKGNLIRVMGKLLTGRYCEAFAIMAKNTFVCEGWTHVRIVQLQLQLEKDLYSTDIRNVLHQKIIVS